MNGSLVNREIRSIVHPALRASGFSAFSPRTTWRHRPDRIDIVNFQSFNSYLASSVGCTTYSFALNLSVYLLDIPDHGKPLKMKEGLPLPDEWLGHLRLHPHRTLEQHELARRDIWFIDPEGTYTRAAVEDARDVIVEKGIPWFERWTDDGAVLAALRQPEPVLPDGTELPGSADSPARNLMVGYVARRNGDLALARQYLSRALEQFEAIDQKNENLELRRPMTSMTPPNLRQHIKDLSV